ncbi:MAG: papain-like cysteine protease family protein [Eubacteriales bacterium]|nr:papain-like cysteine protease family protein [Eubacteriales bacterium]
MKKRVMIISLTCVLGMMTQTVGAAEVTGENGTNFTDEMKMDYPYDFSEKDGPDSVERDADHEDSIYFAHPDFYHMESTDTLIILPHFQTMQQTTEWSCGVAAALMVMNYYDQMGDWTEESLAALRHSLDGTQLDGYPGTTLNQEIEMFEGAGFAVESTKDFEEAITLDQIRQYLKEGKPVCVCWIDWGGHWQVIIGYDTMGTDSPHDDVIIVADPYDTTDHNQDGYGIYSALRFSCEWSMQGYFPEEEGGSDQLFVVAVPDTEEFR